MNRCNQSKWVTEALIAEVRKVFEPRYKRQLTDSESIEIAMNLTTFVEVYAKWRCYEGSKNTSQVVN